MSYGAPPACGDCKYWAKTYPSMPDHKGGTCRRRAPQQTSHQPYHEGQAIWPITKTNDWCGEFERLLRPKKRPSKKPQTYGSETQD